MNDVKNVHCASLGIAGPKTSAISWQMRHEKTDSGSSENRAKKKPINVTG
jgi:hypothetical protein